jgi:DNA primase
VTHQYRVEGPVMMFLTTTAIDLDEELLNRCLVLSVNEDREQTQAIHKLQREQQTLEGLMRKQERRADPPAPERAAIAEAAVRRQSRTLRELTFPDTARACAAIT